MAHVGARVYFGIPRREPTFLDTDLGLASLMGEGESFLVRHLRGGLLRGMRVTCLRSRAYLASVGGISREGCQLHTLPLSLPSPRT